MSKPIVLVDEKDGVVGFGEKFETHKIPVSLHRAISIVILNSDKSKMLITKRTDTKPTWGGFWSNAVCTHPYPDESYQAAADRRIFEELGFRTHLKEVFNFVYEAKMKDKVWGEHELDHVFTGTYDGEVNPNPDEISDFKWIEIKALKKDIENHPDKYTPWAKILFERLMYNT